MTAPVCLVQGASRGIGLQFCRTLLARENTNVIATCRRPETATSLLQLKRSNKEKLLILPLDVTKEAEIEHASREVKAAYGKVDLLINSAGLVHPSGRGETSLKGVSEEALLSVFMTNTVGPLLMAKYFAPLLVNGNGLIGNSNSDGTKNHAAVIVNMSAKVGSITDNGYGGWYSYRMSKAALNMVTKNLSIELGRGQRKVVVISLHPGTVDTDLTKPYQKNIKKLFTLDDSVTQMMNVIDSLSLNDSGKFLLYDRTDMPY